MEINTSNYSIKIRELRDQMVTVRPIKRDGGWVAANHDSAFLNDGTQREYTVPIKKGNTLVNPLTYFVQDRKTGQDDWQELADELGLTSVKELNPNAREDNFWKSSQASVALDKNGKHLNLKTTDGFIDYIVLRSNKHLIAPSWAERFDSGEFMFALVFEGEDLQDKVSNLEENKKAYLALDKIDHSAEKMTDFLYVYYLHKKEAKKPPRNGKVDWLKGEIEKIIKEDLQLFNEILNDEEYVLKLLIQRSVDTGALLRHKHVYSFPGADEPVGVLEDLIDYLNDDRNQSDRIKLVHHVEDKIET
jgi:hypothetical protein